MDPTLTNLLTTNEALDLSQLTLVRDMFKELDEEVSLLRRRLGSLERARQKCLTLLSPLRPVPVDVLGVIIGFAVDTDMSSTGRKELVTLCLVSRAWRQAALATHHLWSTLKVEMKFTQLVYDQAEQWFLRSGTLPRTLTVIAADDDCYYTSSSVCLLGSGSLPRFLVEGPAISNLIIACYDSTCLLNLQTSIQKLQLTHGRPFASNSLSLTVRGDWAVHQGVDHSDKIWRLPPVTTFTLDLPPLPDYHDEDCIIRVPPDFLGRLTTFSFGCDWDGRKLIEVLQACRNLEVLTLDFKASVHVWDEDAMGLENTPDRNVVFPKLRTLKFRRLDES